MMTLEEIIPDDEQVHALYRLLKSRKHGISHKQNPSFVEHDEFVRTHPYRAWFLVQDAGNCIGSVYLHADNSIGIHLEDGKLDEHLKPVLHEIMQRFEPLPAVKSVRNGSFSINVAPTDSALMAALEKHGLAVAQVTYIVGAID
ncbi:hypothetical protein [Hoeflea prorocentri]|uniref:Uncharacterized protein n=1 Tax=Hoeflea prorocentri TaxID=1922333 RepID=A0A9X3UNQ9_9HYPH|nr:hypothetical protein [Hoeflea prorocentri]MCY6383765.1 hypothetical protein [Hoeflea prorocentri]MDA5401565.1 hypothetical protein [Hoeflea prorocentri]